jgi:post-segregation antitoxin (ccd killing protein)
MNTLKTVWIDGEDWEKVKNFGLSPSRVCRDAIRKAIENKKRELNANKK